MGLDMFLFKKTLLTMDYRTAKPEEMKVGDVILPVKSNRISSITEEVLYWRKFNALHNWFVKNVQDGNDDCRDYTVTRENIEELNRISKLVYDSLVNSPTKTIKSWSGTTFQGEERIDVYDDVEVYENTSVAQELLPTISGFYFGDTEYDEYYLDDVKCLIEETQDVLREMDEDEQKKIWTDYFYSSSW